MKLTVLVSITVFCEVLVPAIDNCTLHSRDIQFAVVTINGRFFKQNESTDLNELIGAWNALTSA